MSKAVDFFLVYSFVKRLATPFNKWPAYKLGIIDDKGNVLRKSSELKSKEEIKAWGYYDIMLANLKKLLAKIPGGSNPVVSMTAALALLKEGKELDLEQLHEELTTTASTGVDKTALAKRCKKKRKEKNMKRFKDFLELKEENSTPLRKAYEKGDYKAIEKELKKIAKKYLEKWNAVVKYQGVLDSNIASRALGIDEPFFIYWIESDDDYEVSNWFQKNEKIHGLKWGNEMFFASSDLFIKKI